MNETIAKRLVQLRGDKPRKEVAADLGISVSALSMYENGHRMPRDDVKKRIAVYYSKTVEELFFDSFSHEK